MMNELKFDVALSAGEIHTNADDMISQLSTVMQEYKDRPVTEETKKERKADVAYLRKLKKAVNDRRIAVKKDYMKPYDCFESEVKRLVATIDEPVSIIDGQLKELEEKRVKARCQEIEAVYTEIVGEELEDFIPLETIWNDKWTNATTKLKDVRGEIEEVAVKTGNDLSVIRSMNSEKTEEAVNLYMSCRDLGKAIQMINRYEKQKAEILREKERDEVERLERERQAEIERIRREERERIMEEKRIREEERNATVEQMKQVDEAAAAPLSSRDSVKAIYTVVATPEEQREIEMALTSLGVYYERKDV